MIYYIIPYGIFTKKNIGKKTKKQDPEASDFIFYFVSIKIKVTNEYLGIIHCFKAKTTENHL